MSGRRRPRLVAFQVLPTLVTLGNVLAGFLAIAYVVDSWGAPPDSALREALWEKAAWAIFAGMVCDALDGRVARLTGAASSFGAELDSLADMITFGIAPVLLAKAIAQASFPGLPAKVVTVLAAVYVLGAALRLARYNVESLRIAEPGHVTRTFRGLPSPAAAGVLASLVLSRGEFRLEGLTYALLVGPPILGALMISRFAYPHLMNRMLGGARSAFVVVVLLLAVFLVLEHAEAALAGVFCLYAVSGPAFSVVRLVVGRPRWAEEEEDDEDDLGYGAEREPASASRPAAPGERP